MVEVAGGYQIVTRPELHEWVRRLFHERSTQKLTAQGLETLAVIAYKQPITALEVTEIRGVNTCGVLTTLLERHLIKIVGRKNVVGRPFLYATTKEFLIRFGLKDLSDLPQDRRHGRSARIRAAGRVDRTHAHRGCAAAQRGRLASGKVPSDMVTWKWRFHSVTSRHFLEPLFTLAYLILRQLPPLSWLEAADLERPEPYPPERLNGCPTASHMRRT